MPNLPPDIAERVSIMRKTQLFHGLSQADCVRIAERARTQAFARTDLLFMQGQPLRQIFVLCSGCVKLTHINPSGSEVILAVRGPLDVLDLPSSAGASHVTAQAMGNCRTLSWNSSTAEHLMTDFPPFGSNVCRILSKQLSELQDRYCELSAEKVERRLAFALVRLIGQIGMPGEGGTEVTISRQELAQMTGTTLFTVSRLISKWGELGLVIPRREAVLLIEREGLNLLSSVDESGRVSNSSAASFP